MAAKDDMDSTFSTEVGDRKKSRSDRPRSTRSKVSDLDSQATTSMFSHNPSQAESTRRRPRSQSAKLDSAEKERRLRRRAEKDQEDPERIERRAQRREERRKKRKAEAEAAGKPAPLDDDDDAGSPTSPPSSPKLRAQDDDQVPEMTRKPTSPYPSFSKAHSKEDVSVIRSATAARDAPITPEPTDIGSEKLRQRSEHSTPKLSRRSSTQDPRPPTPPETDLSSQKQHPEDRTRSGDRPKSRTSGASKSSRKGDGSSAASHMTLKEQIKEQFFGRASRTPEPARHSSRVPTSDGPPRRSVSAAEPPRRLPPQFTPISRSASVSTDPRPERVRQPPTPQPPPPPMANSDGFGEPAPRVDYLLLNGGLPQPVSKNFLSVLPRTNGHRPSNPPLTGAQTLFAPFFQILNQYETVLNKQGSIAIATGGRSVARRLLDRLESVFSRDLPPEGCNCIMCEDSEYEARGLGWGEVLEWVSGRNELPQWPPFDLSSLGVKAAELSADLPARPSSPVKMDPDIAEEFREHYLRQSMKVRSAVDKWLSNCTESPSQEIDDETLTFAIFTNLDNEDQPYFNALFTGAKELNPSLRAPTPLKKTRLDFVVKSSLSLQRLYKLEQTPRDAETVAYLVKNPHTHDLLVTLADINTSEYEILTSGRFDGFLWSGADGEDLTPLSDLRNNASANSNGFLPRTPNMSGSRLATPSSPYARGATPASFISLSSSQQAAGNRQPVSHDEEMEHAAVAELEREIFKGMEVLEDAFESLHQRAEVIRTALRNRGAGLMSNMQNRRRIEVCNTPGSENSGYLNGTPGGGPANPFAGDNFDNEWHIDDVDIMPEDSISNISSSRHRRPKRRHERKTPAPIEEDDEEN